MCNNDNNRRQVVSSFCEECVWARSIRTHFAVLFESGPRRHELLSKVANTFFGDLNVILIEYLLLQQCKLTDPASSGKEKDNLTTNYILSLRWSDQTAQLLKDTNDYLMRFRTKVVDARHKLIGHSDLKAKLSLTALGTFTEEEERSFWDALQRFVDTAHAEAIGGPFDLNAVMPNGDAVSLVHSLVDAVDYRDIATQECDFIVSRSDKRQYKDA